MSRYTEARCKLCRREGIKLFLKGGRCYTPKCAVERRAYAPGQHGQKRKKLTQYAIQLREKQKLRRIYGLSESQFKSYFRSAEKQKGISGENFLIMLERRLDNTLFRMGFASSRQQSRQFISHGHILVNGRKVNIPSYLVKPGQVIELKEKTQSNPLVRTSIEVSNQGRQYNWLKTEPEKFRGEIIGLPTRQDIDAPVNEQLVVEFYSK